MNALCVAVLVVAVAAANAGLIAGGLAGSVDSAAVITGPSGQVVRSGIAGIAAPLGVLGARSIVAAHGLPLVAAHAPLAVAVPNARIAPSGLIVPAGNGLEGQWIPDINEHLYDDGSYKPLVYGF